MNKAEAQIKVRDLIMVNILNNLFDEETGAAYREAIRQADEQIEAVLKGSVGD